MVFEKVREILCDQLDVEEDQVTMESNIADDLGADSLDIVEALMELEQTFSISVPDEEIVKFRTPKDILNYIASKKG